MGSPKFPRKKYNTPFHPWKEDRIKSERELIKKYGLKNHKEVWKAKTYLGKYRHKARELLARIEGKDPQVKKESDQLLLRLTRMGVLPASSSLDDVLALETESILSRRLQTLVYLKGLSTTVTHSRQLINHGHIAIGEKKVTVPSYMVTQNEEKDIGFTYQSPLNELSHPARPKTDVYKTGAPSQIIETAKEEKELEKEEKPKSEIKEKEAEEKGEPTEPPKEEKAESKEVVAEKPEEEKLIEKTPEHKVEESAEEVTAEPPKEKEEPTEKSEDIEPKEEAVEKPKAEKPTPAEKPPEKKDKKTEVTKEE